MAIRPRGNSFVVDLQIMNRRYRTTCATRQEAQIVEAQARATMLQGKDPGEDGAPAPNVTMEDLRWEVLAHPAPEGWRDSKAEDSASAASAAWVRYIGEDFDPAEVTAQHLREYANQLEATGNAPATINRKLSAVTKMLRFAFKLGYRDKTVPPFRRYAEPKGRVRVVSEQELDQLVALTVSMHHEYATDLARLWVFLAETGLRVGEALKLRWRGDIDSSLFVAGRGAIHVRDAKNGDDRTIPLSLRARRCLRGQHASSQPRRWKEEGPWTNIPQRAINSVWAAARALMGLGDDLEFVPHALRHTFASRLVRAGVSLQIVSKLLGHRNLQMTDRYAHLAPDNFELAIQALEGDRS
jgi:integrase